MPALPFIPFVDCAESVLRFTLGGRPAFVTINTKRTGGYTLTDLQHLAEDLIAWWSADCRGNFSHELVLQDVKSSGLTTAVDPVATVACTTNCDGANVGASVPNQVAAVITRYTALRGRSYRGRMYWPGTPQDALGSTREITLLQQTALSLMISQLPGALATHGSGEVILSRYNGGVRRTIGVATAVTSYQVRTVLGTIRNRVASV